jgi:hypothetical protein
MDKIFDRKIKELGKAWKESKANPKLKLSIVKSWAELIQEWKDDENLPLMIRKAKKDCRGKVFIHTVTKREIIIVDNSTAQWVCKNIMDNNTFTIKQIKKQIKEDKIPVVYIPTKTEKNNKHKERVGVSNINKLGWKLCHKKNIGLNTKHSVEEISIEELKEHFNLFLNPNNFFVIPQGYGGLGEIDAFKQMQ